MTITMTSVSTVPSSAASTSTPPPPTSSPTAASAPTMMPSKPRSSSLFPLYAKIMTLSCSLTAIIALTASHLESYPIVGHTRALQYPWRLQQPTQWSFATAWTGYAIHQTATWLLIAYMRQNRPKRYSPQMRWFNWAMIGIHMFGFVTHWLQTRYFYDGLAQDVPEITSIAAAAMMLQVIILMESPWRGLIFGYKMSFPQRFLSIAKNYHSYFFSWGLIYTFWYHPMAATPGHLYGFWYMFLLLSQTVLMFHRAHLNRGWKLFLEMCVIPHGVVTAYGNGNNKWQMFGFGFSGIFFLTQIYGLGLSDRATRLSTTAFAITVVGTYQYMDRMKKMHEIVRIPLANYMMIFFLYLIYLICTPFMPKEDRSQALKSAEKAAPTKAASSNNINVNDIKSQQQQPEVVMYSYQGNSKKLA